MGLQPKTWMDRVLQRVTKKAAKEGLRFAVDLAREGLDAIEEEYLDQPQLPKPIPEPKPTDSKVATIRKQEVQSV